MKALPYYKMYPSDAETDENFRSMTDEELGFYWRCLNHAWLNNGLPEDAEERARTFKISPRKEAQLWVRVGRCFRSFGVEGRVFNARQEAERSKAILKSERATESVRSRYERSTNEPPRAYDSESGSDSSRRREEGRAQNPLYGRYLEIVAAWPNPTGVDLGMQNWMQLIEDSTITEENIHEIMEGLERWKISAQWLEKRMIPKVSNWLLEKKWKDRPAPARNFGQASGF